MLRSPYRCRMPEVPFHEAVFFNIRNHSNNMALVMDDGSGRSYTYNELLGAVQQFSAAILKLGVTKGDVVALYMPNSLEFIISLLGVSCVGAISTAINPNYLASEVNHQVSDSRAKLVITVSKNVPIVRAVQQRQGDQISIKNIITVDKPVPGCLYFDDILECRDVSDEDWMYGCPSQGVSFHAKQDVALLMYSSGTTGLPKGVMLTHYNVVSLIIISTTPQLMPPRRNICMEKQQMCSILYLPLFHMYGLNIALSTLALGDKLVVQNGFKPERFLNAIQEYKINILYLVPPTVSFLVKAPLLEKYDVSSVTAVFASAAPLSAEMEDGLTSRLNIDGVYQAYGMTEMTAYISIEPYGRSKRGSSGLLVPNTKAKFLDGTTGKPLSAGQIGEIYLQGPNLMKGYLNKPDATAQAIDGQGWLHTGDIGYYDEDGYIFITGRVKELIKYKGFQVAPAELEGLLLSHPGVADVAVIGVPHPEFGELPKAFIVKKAPETSSVTARGIQDFVRENLSSHKWLRGGVQFVSHIPKTPSGKILRRELKKLNTTSRL